MGYTVPEVVVKRDQVVCSLALLFEGREGSDLGVRRCGFWVLDEVAVMRSVHCCSLSVCLPGRAASDPLSRCWMLTRALMWAGYGPDAFDRRPRSSGTRRSGRSSCVLHHRRRGSVAADGAEGEGEAGASTGFLRRVVSRLIQRVVRPGNADKFDARVHSAVARHGHFINDACRVRAIPSPFCAALLAD
eukprot:2118021-Rhodomonas_salina.1